MPQYVAQVMAHHAVACHAVVVAKPGAICKTTSGMVQRQACRAAYLAGDYTAVRRFCMRAAPRAGCGCLLAQASNRICVLVQTQVMSA